MYNNPRNDSQQKPLCKYFQQGNCKFGNSCKFAHVRRIQGGVSQWGGGQQQQQQQNQSQWGGQNQQTVPKEQNKSTIIATDLSVPPIWPFTCYAWEKEVANDISGTDLSPEELRWEAYKYQSMGNMNQYHQLVQQQLQQTKSKFQALLGATGSNQSQSVSSSMFSSNPFSALQMDNPPQSNPFSNSTSFGAPQQTSPFASQPTQPMFGSNIQGNNNTGMFGGPVTAPTLSAPSFAGPTMFTNPQPAPQPFNQPTTGFSNQPSFGQPSFGTTGLSTPGLNFTNNSSNTPVTAPVTPLPTTGAVQSRTQDYMGPKFSLKNVPEEPPPPEVCN